MMLEWTISLGNLFSVGGIIFLGVLLRFWLSDLQSSLETTNDLLEKLVAALAKIGDIAEAFHDVSADASALRTKPPS